MNVEFKLHGKRRFGKYVCSSILEGAISHSNHSTVKLIYMFNERVKIILR